MPATATPSTKATGTSTRPKLNQRLAERRLGVRMGDGEEMEFGPGEAFAISAGHDGWTVGNEKLVMVLFDQMPDEG